MQKYFDSADIATLISALERGDQDLNIFLYFALQIKQVIKIIGIDPAPTKVNTVFDGNEFNEYTASGLENYLTKLKTSNEKFLICWDAPLSFSTNSNYLSFSKRIIERFFSRQEGYKTPTGISVMGYSNCPHWMISQYMLGLPNVSQFNNKSLPFNLVFNRNEVSRSITEVHPAIAIWLWTKEKLQPEKIDWTYKKNNKSFNYIVNTLVEVGIISEDLIWCITNDDRLDTYIAWKLGNEWLNDNRNKVIILGNKDTGSFLLPHNKDLLTKFDKFCKSYQSK